MKKGILFLTAAGLLVAGVTVNAQEASLSDDWKDYQIQIGEDVYDFPMMYDEFAAYGWTSDGLDEMELEPNQYSWQYFEKDDNKCMIYLLNLGMNTVSADQCIVAGMKIDSMDWDLDDIVITLPGGIVRGEADEAKILETYGTPSDTYEGSLYKKLTYETDTYSSIDMEVYNESGVLETIDIRDFNEPEGFEAGEASEEIPEAVSAYQKPEALSEDLKDYQISIDGEVYAVPVPVSVLIADGWELDEKASDEVIKAGYFGWVTLRKGGQEIRQICRNEENYATIPQNCWVTELEVGGYDLEAEGILPGGICQGMPEADFIKILEDAGMEYEKEDSSGDYQYYNYNNPEYGHSIQVIVYKGETGKFEKDTVMEVACTNGF